MLPALLTAPKKLATAGLTAALITALAAPPAQAWGDTEQGIVAGIATTLLIEGVFFPQMFQSNQPRRGGGRPQGQYQQPQTPAYYTPPPTYTYSSIYTTPAATTFNSYSTNERARIQSTLTAYGYYHGAIDATFGPETYNAVTAYATNAGKTSLLSSTSGAFTVYDALLF